MVSDLQLHRRAFWAYFAERRPALFARTERGNEHSRWLTIGHMPLIAALYLTNRSVGLFVRGPRRTRIGHVREFLFPYREVLAKELRQPELKLGNTFLLNTKLRLDMQDQEKWPTAVAWLAEQSSVYERALAAVQR